MGLRIYTSYFAQIRNFPNDLVPISIARYKPSWYEGKEYLRLAPKQDLIRKYKDGCITEDDYTKRYYMENLYGLNQYLVYDELRKLSGGRDIALCCFESRGVFCHRHIVGVYLNKEGFQVSEWYK